jgi:hypothetical protein
MEPMKNWFGRGSPKDSYPHVVTAQLNAKLQPLDRADHEDPLDEDLKRRKLGQVTGGGTMMADEPFGIAYSDTEISLKDLSDETLQYVVSRLEDLGAPKGSKLIVDANRTIEFGVTEGLALIMNGTDLADEVYARCDINHVVEEGGRLMAPDGRFRSHYSGPKDTVLFFYGKSFEGMKAALAPLLAAYPLCEGAKIERIA